ncbi:hypothetical protein [Janthinobacterium aquaticum]|uniref:hypothetical protein n=1 Tax=Janthinobacterium sp. FT58W TaxID=2654254 RepID=UPI001265155C|nr:hypothetical protein [Janthinobacterium sp. FT58W]KAB8042271.1 hypothetical protein GCM43_14465 [Janthinobacterium sp. FT58W]
MERSAHNDVSLQLDGYLQAVSALKDDGSALRCFYLGPVAPADAFDALCVALEVPPGNLSLQPQAAVACHGLACTPRQWLLERLRPMTIADQAPLDARLYAGFEQQLLELLGDVPEWRQLVSDGQRNLAAQLGAIWSVYVFGVAGHSYVLQCSWDS